VGKILPDNGFDALVRAFRLIPAAEFVIIGEAERGDQQSDGEARRLRGLAERLGVADRLRVHAHATVAEIPELLRSADVVACTPTYEPSGAGSNGLRRPGGGLRGRPAARHRRSRGDGLSG
jgi:D-inositol-3-phosphate glycosyltransferase